MDPLEFFFRFVGLFYLVGCFFALRAILMDSVLDKALSALSAGKEDPKEKGRRLVVGSFTIVFGAGGMALLLMNFWALPLFLGSLAAQIVWLFWARRFFIPAEEDDAASVNQLRNSSILYAAATLGVVWLWREGALGPWDDPLAAALVAAVAVGFAGWFFYHLSWKPGSPGLMSAFADDGDDEPEPMPARIVIDPARWCWPLIDADTEGRFNHLKVLDEELGWRVEEWDRAFQNAFDPDDDMAAIRFASPEAMAEFIAEGEAIARELGAVCGTDNVTFGPGWADIERAEA